MDGVVDWVGELDKDADAEGGAMMMNLMALFAVSATAATVPCASINTLLGKLN